VTGDSGAGVLLVAQLTKFLAGRGFILKRRGIVRRPVTRLGTCVRSGELLVTKEVCGHKKMCDCSYFIQIPNAQL
jgi:hypothetical protein